MQKMYQALYANKGFVKLVDVIPSQIPNGFSSRDAVIAMNAQICVQKDTIENNFDAYNLLEKLFQWGHFSPFEQAVLQFRIKAPYVVWSQVDRHRTFIYSSQLRRSGRYADFSMQDFYIPEYFSDTEKAELESVIRSGYDKYLSFTNERQIAREHARLLLPAFCLMYEDLLTVNLKNLMHFLSLRTHEAAQLEIRELANATLWLTELYFPYTIKLFKQNNKPVNYMFNEV